MKNIIKFLEINLSAIIALLIMASFIIIQLKNLDPIIPRFFNIIIYSASFILLLLQFLIWKENKMLNKDLISFFIALMVSNIAILKLELLPSGDNFLGEALILGSIVTISMAIVFIKIITWLFLINFKNKKYAFIYLILSIFKKSLFKFLNFFK